MTIDDELLLELLKPDKQGEVGKNAPIKKIVGEEDIDYKLEEAVEYTKDRNDALQGTYSILCPDIIVSTKGALAKQFAVEIENDLNWDFQTSLRHLKNYQTKFRTTVIIPKEFERFAPLYKKAGFKVYLWTAERQWQCLKCGTEITKEGSVVPECPKCKNRTLSAFKLAGLKDTNIEEF